MKYTTEIEIEKPIEKVIELFDNPDNLKKWMEGLQSFEHLSGTPGQPGAKSRLFFKMGFHGKYILYDLPQFSALQTYYLKSVGIPVCDFENFSSSLKSPPRYISI